jgi:hypothetical protein
MIRHYLRMAAVLGATVLVAGIVHIGSRPRLHAPVTVTFQERLFDRHGTLQGQDLLKMAVREDGSVMDERTTNRNGVPCRTRSVHDLSSGTKTVLDEITHSKTSYHRLRLRAFEEAYLSPGGDVSGDAEAILGVPTVRVTQRNSRSTIHRWLAPDFDYFQLRAEFILYENNGAVRARTVREAVQILQGAPDPALFEIPDSYVERSPSEVYSEQERLGLRPCPLCGDKAERDARLDDIYGRWRP